MALWAVVRHHLRGRAGHGSDLSHLPRKGTMTSQPKLELLGSQVRQRTRAPGSGAAGQILCARLEEGRNECPAYTR